MKRSAGTADFLAPASGMLLEAAAAATSFFWRNPGVAGGSTAFAVAFLFVSANAVWYQEHRHPAPLFVTRAGETPPRFAERIPARADADDAVAFVQQALTDMSLYTGSVDGVSGPRTREAVSAYRRQAGLDPAGGIDKDLLARLKARDNVAPLPTPAPRKAIPSGEPDEDVAFVQGRLTTLGYPGVDIDGLSGSRTRSAILDFQGKNGLPETGAVDEALLKALRRAPKG